MQFPIKNEHEEGKIVDKSFQEEEKSIISMGGKIILDRNDYRKCMVHYLSIENNKKNLGLCLYHLFLMHQLTACPWKITKIMLGLSLYHLFLMHRPYIMHM